MRPVILIFATQLALWTVVGMLNQWLAPLHAYVFAGGLFVVYASLHLPAAGGLAAALLAGAMLDANSPVPFGTHALLLAGAHTVLVRLRERLPNDETSGLLVVALLCNLPLILLLSFLRQGEAPEQAAYWLRVVGDLFVSQIALLGIGPWFFAFQKALLSHGGGRIPRRA